MLVIDILHLDLTIINHKLSRDRVHPMVFLFLQSEIINTMYQAIKIASNTRARINHEGKHPKLLNEILSLS